MKQRIIPQTLDECSAADRKLLEMRDAGEGWRAIRKMWEETTGEPPGTSTLPNRYNRLKYDITFLLPD